MDMMMILVGHERRRRMRRIQEIQRIVEDVIVFRIHTLFKSHTLS